MNPQGKGKIEWTDYTWNPVTGCLKGCSYCYAKRTATKGRAKKFYPNGFVPELHPERLQEPLKLKKPSKIFVCDMGDLFGDWVSEDWIEAVLLVIRQSPQHTYQLLTKNPGRYYGWAFPDNCWLGTTIDTLEVQHQRFNALAFAKAPVKFISFEPLLGPMNVEELGFSALDWMIVGEQTARSYTVDEKRDLLGWAQGILHRAQELKIPIFFKNWLGTMFPQREFPR